jgi:hypothetical protein
MEQLRKYPKEACAFEAPKSLRDVVDALFSAISQAFNLRFSFGMSRYDPTDFEWRVIEPLLPDKPRGYRVSTIAESRTASSWFYFRGQKRTRNIAPA